MKTVQMLVACTALIAPLAMAQQWEFGGGVGGGFYTSQDVTSSAGSATAKIQTGLAGSVWLGRLMPTGTFPGTVTFI